MDDRMTITNMAIEAGGKNGIFEPDDKTFAYVDARTKANGTKAKYDPLFCDSDDKQKFVYDKKFDLSKLEPTVACHPNPGNRKLAKELGNVQLDRAYIGSCTGGKTSDFLAFAEVIKGHKVKIDTFGVPATPDTVRELQAAKMNGKTVWQVLEEAGVQMTENASCAACLGGPTDTFGRLNKPMKCISATNRNFPGAWATSNPRCSSRRRTPLPPARSRDTSPIREKSWADEALPCSSRHRFRRRRRAMRSAN